MIMILSNVYSWPYDSCKGASMLQKCCCLCPACNLYASSSMSLDFMLKIFFADRYETNFICGCDFGVRSDVVT